MEPGSIFLKQFEFNIGKFSFTSSYLLAGLIILLLFVLVLSFARLRRMYVNWNLKGAGGMIIVGFIIALVLEGFLLLGGRTFLTVILGWKNPPAPLSTALDVGRSKLVDVLGVTDEIPASSAKETSVDGVITSFQSLSPQEARKVRNLICEP